MRTSSNYWVCVHGGSQHTLSWNSCYMVSHAAFPDTDTVCMPCGNRIKNLLTMACFQSSSCHIIMKILVDKAHIVKTYSAPVDILSCVFFGTAQGARKHCNKLF